MRKVIRPFSDKLKFLTDASQKLESDYEDILVVKIPFNCEVRIKAICVAGAPEGFAPSKLKVYKNEQNVDFDIVNDKKPIQTIDLAENIRADFDYPVNISKFENCSNIVLGF